MERQQSPQPQSQPPQQGLIRVGRCRYRNGNRVDPEFPGFTNIICLTKSSNYGQLGPFCLKDEYGRIMENFYQSCKVYPSVPESLQYYSRYNPRVIWEHPAEVHAGQDIYGTWHIQKEYWAWRRKLQVAKDAIRYPVTFDRGVRASCAFSLKESVVDGKTVIDPNPLNYVMARKQIYGPTYNRLVKDMPLFHELKVRHLKGENLLIIEVDAPHEEDLNHYMIKYGVGPDFITNDTMLATQENLLIMLNDTRHPCGHGYFLAALLQDISLE